MVLVFYISAHGFGHAARSIEVINALLAKKPGAGIIVRTSAPRWLFDLTVRGAIEFQSVECDTGVWQLDSLHLDERRTLARAREFYATFEDRAGREAAFLRDAGATLVAADMPPLAFAAAARAAIPSIALGNFTWDWIYDDYAARESPPGSRAFIHTIKEAYRRADLVLRMPMWGGFAAFDAPIVDLPFVARHAVHSPAETKTYLDLNGVGPIVLASFGGHDIHALDIARLGRQRRYRIVMTTLPVGHAGADEGSAVTVVDEKGLYRGGFRYEDLVAMCDVVATKPGYGIIAECVANDAAMLYTSRGHFREYPVLVDAMTKVLRCRFIEQDRLQAGDWEDALDALLAQPAPRARPATNGADVAATKIIEVGGGQ